MVKEAAPTGSTCNPESGNYDCSLNDAVRESIRGDRNAESMLEALAFGAVESGSIRKLETRSNVYTLSVLPHGGKPYKKINALFKAADGTSTNMEVATVAVSQTLDLDVTPLGVLRTIEIDGKPKTGYLQQWLPGKSLNDIKGGQGARELVTGDDHYLRYNSVAVLDYLMFITDRAWVGNSGNLGNWLLGDDKKLYALDNGGGSFHGGKELKGMVCDGEIPISTANTIIRFVQSSSSNDFLRDNSFSEDERKCLQKRIKTVADHISFHDKKAFVDANAVNAV